MSVRNEWKADIAAPRSLTYPSAMDAPWQALPDIPAGSIGWRMGRGEDYIMAFWKWFNALTPPHQATYKDEHPEPEGWRGFYSSWHGN